MKYVLALLMVVGRAHAERHVVQRGETLEHVAVGHGCSIEAVQRANALTTTLVMPGTVLDVSGCSITSRARTRVSRPVAARAALGSVTAASPDTDKALHALAVIDGATWVSGGSAWRPAREPAGHDRDLGIRERDAISAAETVRPPTSSRPSGEHSTSIGEPWRGRLEHAAHLDPGDGYTIRRPARAYGTDRMVTYLRHAIAEVRALYPNVHTLAIGDLSAEHGGQIADHHSHQSGLDVDVGFYFRQLPPGYPNSFAPADANLDLEATWALLAAFARTTDRDDGVAMIFLDYRVQQRLYEWAQRRGTRDSELDFLFQYPHGEDATTGLVRHWPQHANHFHVRFKP